MKKLILPNQNRREFIKKSFRYATVGGAVLLLPTTAYTRYLEHLEKSKDPVYDFEAYEDTFQENTKKYRIDGATQKELGTDTKIYGAGQGKGGWDWELGKKIIEHQDENPDEPTPDPTTPVSRWNTGHDYGIRGQVLRMPDGGELRAVVKGSDNKYHVVPFCFMTVIELKEYYCYGVPSSDPQKFTCRYCSERYYYQQFYYDGEHTYDPNKKYSEKTTNFYCDEKGMKCSISPTGFHSDLKMDTISPCVCDDQYRPVLNKDNSKY